MFSSSENKAFFPILNALTCWLVTPALGTTNLRQYVPRRTLAAGHLEQPQAAKSLHRSKVHQRSGRGGRGGGERHHPRLPEPEISDLRSHIHIIFQI
ncbi:hypothetical protein F4779DRAFT_605449 [Xylariaceae sp. FL0662B]|nr:hypothetical protein F4779DRAFT_605449 [Xylariaceae sp. FL0662B]